MASLATKTPMFSPKLGESSPTTVSPPSTTSNFSEFLDTHRPASPPPPAEPDIDARQGKAATPRNPFSTATLARDSTFYFEEDMILEIQIEETLFRIPRTVLTLHSEHFKAMLHKRDAEGDTYEPLHLDGDEIKATAFKNLLHVLYPPSFGKIQISSVDDWTSVLDISTKWGFAAVRALAVERLADIASPAEKIALARVYKLNHWIRGAFTAVCERSEPLTPEEIRRLTPEDIAKICEVREAARGGLLSYKVGGAVSSVLSTAPAVLSWRAQKKKEEKSQKSVPSDVISGIDRTLPLSEVLDVVRSGLVLISDQDPGTQQQGQDGIVDAVRHSDKHGSTLRSVFALIVAKGMKSSPGEGDQYTAVCGAVADLLGSDFKDYTLANSDGQPLSGREAVAHYITSTCEDVVKYTGVENAMKSDIAMRQAGFCASLFAKKLVDVRVIQAWWDTMNICTKHATTSSIRNYHAFLSAVGHLIDLPEVQSNVKTIFNCFGNSGYYQNNSWYETRSEMQGLTALRARKWSKQ